MQEEPQAERYSEQDWDYAKALKKSMFWAKATAAAAVVGAVLSVAVRFAAGADATPVPQASAMTILGNDSYLRAQFTFKTPVVVTSGGEIKTPLDPGGPWGPHKVPTPFPEVKAPPPPPPGWVNPEFDDSLWERRRAPCEFGRSALQGGHTPMRFQAPANSLICLRSKFVVDDPAKVADLKLTIEYVGGAVVYVNGQELKRGNLPEGELKPDTLAEKYPDDLYCEPAGMYLDDSKKPEFGRRYRKLSDLAVPSKLLRKGTNVLAVEIHRAPINEAVIATKHHPFAGSPWYPCMWAYAGLSSLRLTAAADSAVAPNVARPPGVQVWNPRPFDAVTAFDYGEPEETPRPVTVSAARNGVFSGRLIVSSDQAIKGLKVTVSDLARAPSTGSGQATGGGKLPASAVRVRCAEPAEPAKSWMATHRFDGLLDAIPAEIPVGKVPPPARDWVLGMRNVLKGDHGGQEITRKGLTTGATAPLWLTVRPPRDAQPGRYEGTVTVSAEGLKPTAVPLRVNVSAWTVPDPKDFLAVRNLIVLSEDSLALYYKVPRWSDRHFELMGKSLALATEVGSRLANGNVAIGFHGGDSNAEGMIRWIKQLDLPGDVSGGAAAAKTEASPAKTGGTYTYDFAIFDKYLDLVAKTIGKPFPLRLNCWGEWMQENKDPTKKYVWRGPSKVTLLDPATGKLDQLEQPGMDKPDEFIAFWKPVLDEARKRIEARGWFEVTSVGHNSYSTSPHPKIVSAYKKIWPDGVWSSTSHNSGLGDLRGEEKDVTMPCRYAESLWTGPVPRMRGYRELLKPRAGSFCRSPRELMQPGFPLTNVRDQLEGSFMGGGNGLGDFGADLFPLKTTPDSRHYYHVNFGRGTGGPNYTSALLVPGADGPIATERYEMFREGVELAEAIVFLERALQDKKIGGDLEQRANRCLDERCEAFLREWWWPLYQFERDAKLLELAGEVATAIAGGN